MAILGPAFPTIHRADKRVLSFSLAFRLSIQSAGATGGDMCHSVVMRRSLKYQNRYQRRRARRLARRKGNQPSQARQSANTRGALWLRLFARLVRVMR